MYRDDTVGLHRYCCGLLAMSSWIGHEDWMNPLIEIYKKNHHVSDPDALKRAYKAGLKRDWDTYNRYIGLMELAYQGS